MSQSQFDQVSVIKKANVYFDGKCVSHTVQFADGVRKSVGVIMPSSLRFETKAPERMEVIAGECRVKLEGSDTEEFYKAGQFFVVPGDSYFDIVVENEPLHYVCHFEG